MDDNDNGQIDPRMQPSNQQSNPRTLKPTKQPEPKQQKYAKACGEHSMIVKRCQPPKINRPRHCEGLYRVKAVLLEIKDK